jgi:nucleotide-binding universal stress UspA family protein
MSWLKKQKVVVPIDFSDASMEAVDVALQLAEQGDGVYLIHVLPKLSVAEPGVVWDAVSDESRAANVRESVRERLAGDQYESLHVDVEFGDPGNQIVDFAERISADLIVIPCRGRTGIERLLLGSVAERVARLAPCPVLVLRG